MDVSIRCVALLFVIYGCLMPSLISAKVQLKFNASNEFELLQRAKAADIKSWMDMSTDPCKDFYDYACGKWDRIQAGYVQKQYAVSKYDIYSGAMGIRVRDLLTNTKSGDFIQDKIHDFMESCRDVEKNTQSYKEEVKNLLRREFGEFSYLKNANEEKATRNFAWWQTAAKIYSVYDERLIVRMDIDYNLKTRHRTSIFLGKPDKTKAKISQSDIEVLFESFFNVSSLTARQIASDVHEFSEAMKDAGVDHLTSGLPIQEQFNLVNLTDLKSKYMGVFDVEAYVKMALNITIVPEQVYLETGGYIDELLSIFKDTIPVTIEHYILYTLLEQFAVDFYDEIETVCLGNAVRYFGKYIQHAIYEQYRSKEFETQIFELWNDIKTTFRNDLQSDKYQWISKASRNHAIRKLNNMKFQINHYDNENFEEYFQTLPIDRHNFAQNLFNVAKHYTINRGVRMQVRTDSIDDVNACSYTPAYMPNLNEIRIPVSFFQPYYIWHPSYPRAILYAHFGVPVAHEVVHAFDDNGRHFDAEGNANNWWDENASKEFEIRRRCFQDQYHSYSFHGIRLPDLPAQGENIADNGGVKIAYNAYKRWLEKAKTTGEDMNEQFKNWPHITGEELFFISFGQYRCQSLHDDLREAILSDVHSPHRLRVIGPLVNFPQFSNVFHCAKGSAMTKDPSKICEIF